MKEEYLNERVQASVRELFEVQREAQGSEHLGIAELVREGARIMIETALEVELEEFLGRVRYRRGGRRRSGYRNGIYERSVKTLAGELAIRKPKVRATEVPFESKVLRAWQRRCDELSAMIPGLYLEGLSTRDFRRACGIFWGEAGLSRSAISRLNQRLHEEFDAWRQRDLSGEGLVFLYLDAHYTGVRFGTGEKEAVLVAHGIRTDGSRSVLSIRLGGRESTNSWAEVLHDLDRRKLPRPMLVISDGNPGLIRALKDVWPDLPRQRCVEHRTRNILDKVPKNKRDEIRRALMAIWHADSLEAASKAAQTFMRKYGKLYKAATECLMECLNDCLTFLRFPKKFRKRIRTSNPLERTFKEVRRRTRVVGRFPTESSALAVIYGILTMESAKWRGIKFTPTTLLKFQEIAQQLKTDPIVIDFDEEAA